MASNAQVQEIYIELSANIAKFKSAMNQAQSETQKFSREMKSQMREAQGSIALLGEDLGVVLPRHLRTFVAGLPGVASAMSAAFNAVAVIALIDVVVKAGEKVAEFIEKSNEAAQKHQETWRGITGAINTSNDELQVTNDKLADSIAKLEHKPQNRMKEAIDEAILSADKLGNTLDADLQKISEALKGEQTGVLARIGGEAGSSDVTEHARALQTDLQTIQQAGLQQLAALRAHNATQADIDKVQQQIDADQKARVDRELATFANPQLQQAQSEQQRLQANAGIGFLRNSRVNALSDYASSLSGMSTTIGLTDQNTQLTQQLGTDQGNKDAQAQLLKDLQGQLEAVMHNKEMLSQAWTPADDAAFWQEHMSAFTKGSEEYATVQKNFFTAQEQMWKQFAMARKAMQQSMEMDAKMSAPISFTDNTENNTKLNQATARDAEAQGKAAEQYQLVGDKIAYAHGQITAYDLAVDEAQAHQKEYQNQIDALQKELASTPVGPLTPENAAKAQQIQTQINDLSSKQQIQAMEDAQNAYTHTWKGSIASIYDTVIQKANSTSQQIVQISGQVIDGINTQLAKLMTGQKFDFASVFRNASESLAKTGLEKLEGTTLGALGLGKRDGSTEQSAMWVQLAGGGALAGMPSFSGLATQLPKIVGPNSSVSSVGSGLLGLLTGGHFATGGDVMGGVPIDVGELGPERFVPYTNGRIIPNNQLNSGGHTFNIDATGSNDPAQTEAAVRRGIAAAAPHIVAASIKANQDRAARRPPSAR